jgi:hypothetical protein
MILSNRLYIFSPYCNFLFHPNISSSAQDANYTATARHIVISPTRVLNAEDSTTRQLVKKSTNIPAKCGICGGAHPTNYKGCNYYHNLTRNRNISHKPQTPNAKYNSALTSQSTTPLSNSQPTRPPSVNRTYADVTRGRNENNQDMTLSTFLEEFKQMFNQIVQQNSLVLNMLAKLPSKMQ